MKPCAFDYVRVDSPEEAVALLREYGDEARVLAGGQSLMPLLNMRLASPAVLLDISRAPALDYIRIERAPFVAAGSAAARPGFPARRTPSGA
jgi:2-furoyl-CoA dehydrogenase FAD binding subunit